MFLHLSLLIYIYVHLFLLMILKVIAETLQSDSFDLPMQAIEPEEIIFLIKRDLLERYIFQAVIRCARVVTTGYQCISREHGTW